MDERETQIFDHLLPDQKVEWTQLCKNVWPTVRVLVTPMLGVEIQAALAQCYAGSRCVSSTDIRG